MTKKPGNDEFQAQFKGELHPANVRLRFIGYRVMCTDGGKTVLSGIHSVRAHAEVLASQMQEQGLGKVCILPAYDWRDFLYASHKEGKEG